MLKKIKIRFREPLADALRNTVAVVLPLLVLYSGYRETGIGISVGALLISLTDLPGNRRHKTGTAIQNIGVFFVIALLFAACNPYPVFSGIILVSLTFLMSLLAAFGPRSAATGSMSVALMIFILGLKPAAPLQFSVCILAGSCWYYGISLLQVYIWPFRSLHQALREALAATADVLEAKAMCYDTTIPLDESYRKTIALHMRIAQKQETVRQLLLGDRRAIRKQNPQLQDLLNAAIRVIGLYELVTAMHYDYAAVRQQLNKLDILENTRALILQLASQARLLSRKWPYQKAALLQGQNFNQHQDKLQLTIAQLPVNESTVVRGIITNVSAIREQLAAIYEHRAEQVLAEPAAVQNFLTDSGSWQQRLSQHFNWYSPVFRLALRLSFLLLTGYLLITQFSKDQYSYWCLLTIVIVTRPQLATTWQRNIQRITGTLAGVCLAFLLLLLIKSAIILLTIAAFALLGFFVWNRPKYDWSVVCVTVCVVLCLNLYHGEIAAILSARIVYTITGCILAFTGMFVFPAWVSAQLPDLMDRAIEGNRLFLQAVLDSRDQRDIWLVRKTAHERLAQLAEAIRHTRPEPHRLDLPAVENMQTLNYRINAVITSLFLVPRKAAGEQWTSQLQVAVQYLSPGQVTQSNADISDPSNKTKLLKGTSLLTALAVELYEAKQAYHALSLPANKAVAV